MPNVTLKSIFKTLSSRYQTLQLEYPVDMSPRYGFGKPPHAQLAAIIEANRDVYAYRLGRALAYIPEFIQWPGTNDDIASAMPAWNNGFLPGLDIVMLYTMIAEGKPETYIEIGSGNSTKVAARAKADQQLSTKMISIDPYPRAEIDSLADTIIRQPFEKTDLSVFSSLKSGDIVFVDNSHRVFPNSDATVFFLDVLPYLPAGVIVHIHDIYLPFDYPQDVCDRYYSEQYVLAAFLLANPVRYYTLMPNYFVSEDELLSQILLPLWDHPGLPSTERHGASYWIQIRG